jgi:hypothetical protein
MSFTASIILMANDGREEKKERSGEERRHGHNFR